MAPRIKFAVKEVDRGYKKLRELAKGLRDRDSYVKIGVIGAKGAEDHPDENGKTQGLTNAQLAVIHEFGAPAADIPARPFVSASFNRNKPAYVNMLRSLLKGLYQGKTTATKVLGIVGAKAAADVKSYVTSGPQVPPPNSPAVLARKQAKTRKGSSGGVRTLIDTGRMIGAISWLVVTKFAKEGSK